MYDQLIQTQATAAEFACKRLSPRHRSALHDSVKEACHLPAESGWDRKAAAHAAFFSVLAEAAGDAVVAPVLIMGGELAYDLMVTAGRAADGIVMNCRRRFLEYLRLGNAERAAQVLEEHLRVLDFMCRLAGRSRGEQRLGRSPGPDRAPTQSSES
jgi:DNA-binding GntR family transcriptional regulator